MSLYKRGDTWWYEFVFSGERIRESTKQSNKRTAEQMEAARRTQLAKGEVGIKDRKAAPTLAEYANKSFLPHVRANKKKTKTVAFYENSVRNLLAFEKLGSARLDQIDVPLIDSYITRRRAVNLELSTINRELATLRRMFNLLPDLRSDLSIALPRVKVPTKDENRRERVVSPEEEEAYLAAAVPLLKDVAAVLLDTGFRPEEVYGLKWSYIRNGNIENYDGKTSQARRSVPGTARVLAIFERRFPAAVSEWIFSAPTISGHMEQSSIKKQHATALKAAGIDPFVVYSFRHTCLSRWASEGMNPYELMRRAGHADFATTMRYVHMAKPTEQKTSPEVQGTTKSPHRASFTVIKGKAKAG